MIHRVFLNRTVLLLAVVGVISCVTVNIYFPAEEVRKVAKEFVDDVAQQGAEPAPPETAPKPQSFLVRTMYAVVTVSEARAQSATTVSNATIRALKEKMTARRGKLIPLYQQKIIKENDQGYLDTQNLGGVDMKTRATAQQLVQAENADRKALYEEVARALQVDPSQVGRIGAEFAQEWKRVAP